MKKLFLLFFVFVIGFDQLHAHSNSENLKDSVEVYVKRGKGVYGAAVKWPIYVADAQKYNELRMLKADKYLRENKKGKIGKNEYVRIRIAASTEQLVQVGSSYFHITASPGSTIEILVEGTEAGISICEGTADAGMGFQSPNILLYRNTFEEIVLENTESCTDDIPNLTAFKEVIF